MGTTHAHDETTPATDITLRGIHWATLDGTMCVELRNAAGEPRERYVFPMEWMEFMGDHITADLRSRRDAIARGE